MKIVNMKEIVQEKSDFDKRASKIVRDIKQKRIKYNNIYKEIREKYSEINKYGSELIKVIKYNQIIVHKDINSCSYEELEQELSKYRNPEISKILKKIKKIKDEVNNLSDEAIKIELYNNGYEDDTDEELIIDLDKIRKNNS